MRTNKKIAVKVVNVEKVYTFKSEKPTFIETMFNKKVTSKHTALKDINLTIKQGEKVGIIGSNGAGKTTLLKIIVGIATPKKGSVEVNGRVVSLINLMAGFHPEMSGYENIKINGLLIGMKAEEIRRKTKKIIRFADIGKFVYAPLHTYSTGMKLRLGFSIAVHSDPDIMVLDEGLSAGDEKFQKKAGKVIKEMFKKDKTIIVVSHWLEFLSKNCNRIIWMDNGKIIADGNKKIIKDYVAESKKRS